MDDPIEKQSYEEFTISANFGRNMVSGETISSCAVSAIDVGGSNVTATITDQTTILPLGTKVSVLVRAGSADRSPYKITFRCVTSAGHKWEHDIQMRVREI